MAFTVSLYTFSKRENSTKRPDTSPATFACTLKSNCSIHNPVLEMRLDENPTQYNYVEIGQFGRYYFIESWEWDAGRWLAHCREDVLATWKDIIGSSTQYVTRSSAQSDGNIIDNLYPTLGGANTVTNAITNPFPSSYSGGTYLLGIINNENNQTGVVGYYAFRPDDFRELMNTLLNDVEWLNISGDEISEGLTKALFNPVQYITSCQWFPILQMSGELQSTTPFGWWELSCGSRPISALSRIFETQTITIPKHPLTASRGMYLNLEPYARYWLRCRPFGDIPLDSTLLYNESSIKLVPMVDYPTGQGFLNIYAGSDTDNTKALAYDRCQLSLPIPLAQMSRDYLNMATTAVSSLGGAFGAALSADVGGFIENTVSGIGNTIKSSIPQLRTSGSVGAIAEFSYNWSLNAAFYSPVAEDNADRGRPLCQMRQISTIPGYIMCADADVELPASAEENREVKAYMESGFFFE